jgi:hypothetical protein
VHLPHEWQSVLDIKTNVVQQVSTPTSTLG